MRAVSAMKLLVVAATLMCGAAAAQAFEEKAYDPASFKAAQGEGKPILVDVFAPWCPVCIAQQKVLGTLKDNPAYASVVLFKVDFDNDPAALKTALKADYPLAHLTVEVLRTAPSDDADSALRGS